MTQPLKAVTHDTATLRPTTEADLPAISELTERVFGRRRSLEVLRWLLLSAQPGLDIQSEVAVNNRGRIVGHVGVLKSLYQWGEHIAVGAHPMLWMLHPDARGRIGVLLGRACTRSGDFSLVVGGTPDSKPIMERRRFVRSAATTELRLSTHPAAPAEPADELALRPFEPAPTRLLPAAGPVVSLPSPARLKWLAACPTLEARLFSLFRGEKNLGPVLLYLNRRGDEASGRVVHLPWGDGDWVSYLRLALAELAAGGCRTASILVTSERQLETVRALGGEPFYERLIFFRNQSGLPEASGWHLTYLEGDLAYRRV